MLTLTSLALLIVGLAMAVLFLIKMVAQFTFDNFMFFIIGIVVGVMGAGSLITRVDSKLVTYSFAILVIALVINVVVNIIKEATEVVKLKKK